MQSNIYIVSGFLGAGKTTFIKKLLTGAFKNKKVAVIENDFGDVSIDTSILENSGIEIREITSGCICCSLIGNFITSINELCEKYEPEIIIIEPSGVGKLSDIVRACENPLTTKNIKIMGKINVVDVRYYMKISQRATEFFLDQIENADALVLSRTGDFPDKVSEVFEHISKINPHAKIFDIPFEKLNTEDVLNSIEKEFCSCCEHGHNCGCEHNHDHSHAADEVFSSITLIQKSSVSKAVVTCFFNDIMKGKYGEIARAKGILKNDDGSHMLIQYTKNELNISSTESKGRTLCIIGENLKKEELKKVFG